jgi:hypothetical protein
MIELTLSQRMLRALHAYPRAFLASAAWLWWALYPSLVPASEALVAELPVHDLHLWAMGTNEIAVTAHLVMPAGGGDDAFLKHASDQLREQCEIRHVTLQVVREAFCEGCARPTPSR